MDFRLRKTLANILRAAFVVAIVVVALLVNHAAGWLVIIVALANVLILLLIELAIARKSGAIRPTSRHRLLVPQELPPQIGEVLGRGAELAQVLEAAKRHRRRRPLVIQIIGTAGIGKTALALVVAGRLASRYPDGQLYELLDGRTEREILRKLVNALKGPREKIPASGAAAWRELTQTRRFMAILDDAPNSASVLPLIPQESRSAIIITAQEQLDEVPSDVVISLAPLAVSQTLELLQGMLDEDRVPAASPQAQRIAEITAGIPLAVRLTGAALALRPQWDMHLVLRHVDQLTPSPGIRTLDVCYALMTEVERRALCLLTLVQTADFSAWHLQAMQGLSENDAWQIADRLAYGGLVDRRTDDVAGIPTFHLLEHVRTYAEARRDVEVSQEQQQVALDKLEAAKVLRSKEVPSILLRSNVYNKLETGHLLDALNGARDVLALVRAKRVELPAPSRTTEALSRRDEGLALAALAEIQGELGSIEESWDLASSALDIRHPDVTPRALRCLGTLQFMMSPQGDGTETLGRALTAAIERKDGAEQTRILRRLAVALAHKGDFPAAELRITQARQYCADRGPSGNRLLVGVMWAEAVVHTLQDRPSDAHGLLRVAHMLAGQHNQRLWRGWIDHQLAYVALLSNDFQESRRWALQGIDMFTELGHRYGVAHCRLLGGMALLKMKRPQESLTLLEEALSTFVTCGDIAANARAGIALAEAQRLLGRNVEARRHLVFAVRSLESSGDWAEESKARNLLWRLKLPSWLPSWTPETRFAIRSASPGQ